MTAKEEEKILEKAIPEFRELTAAELSSRIIEKLSPQERKPFLEGNRNLMRYCLQAEEALRQGRARHAQELLEYAMKASYHGREYLYGLLGDAYMRLGNAEKAAEMYSKSGSHDSLRKLRRLRG
jgi:tetratricopeptide (TPR) repeat protein